MVLRKNGGDLVARSALGDVDLDLDASLDRRFVRAGNEPANSRNDEQDDRRNKRYGHGADDEDGNDGLTASLGGRAALVSRLDAMTALRAPMRRGRRAPRRCAYGTRRSCLRSGPEPRTLRTALPRSGNVAGMRPASGAMRPIIPKFCHGIVLRNHIEG